MSDWLLSIDTATDALSVAVGRIGDIRFSSWQRRRKGHAEELAPLIERALDASGIKAADLAAIAVTVGPGTFTGVRIGLAAARGMRIALQIPVIGVNTLELLAFQAAGRWPDRPVLAALDARRGQVYAQYFRRARQAWPEPWCAATALPASSAADMLTPGSILVGSGARLIAEEVQSESIVTVTEMAPEAAAAFDMVSLRKIPPRIAPPPSPMYLRAADAVPARPLLNL